MPLSAHSLPRTRYRSQLVPEISRIYIEKELRSSFVLAELERVGGIASHVSPLTTLGDVGNLLVQAGFTLPTVDQEALTVEYQDPWVLMHELRAMAENAAPAPNVRRAYTPRQRPFFALCEIHYNRDAFVAASAVYTAMYGREADDGALVVPATFQLLWMIGWAPHQSQPQPKRRGSQQRSLKEI